MTSPSTVLLVMAYQQTFVHHQQTTVRHVSERERRDLKVVGRGIYTDTRARVLVAYGCTLRRQ